MYEVPDRELFSTTVKVIDCEPSQASLVGRASDWSHTVRQRQCDRSQFQTPPMPAYRYMEENGSAAMLPAKRLAVVTPEVNLRECITHTPLPSVNKAAHSEEMSPEVQNRGINSPHKKDVSTKKFKKAIDSELRECRIFKTWSKVSYVY